MGSGWVLMVLFLDCRSRRLQKRKKPTKSFFSSVLDSRTTSSSISGKLGVGGNLTTTSSNRRGQTVACGAYGDGRVHLAWELRRDRGLVHLNDLEGKIDVSPDVAVTVLKEPARGQPGKKTMTDCWLAGRGPILGHVSCIKE
jgi:hypothetical protein